MTEFKFDEWAKLAQEDPEAFEQKREEFLETYICEQWDDPDEQQRARAILWRAEMNYSRIKDPTERFNRVVADFYDQVVKFRDAINSLTSETK